MYIPSFGITTFPSSSAPSSLGATFSSIGTSTFSLLIVVLPALNTGVPNCFSPLSPIDVTSLAVGVTPFTVGVYLALTDVPFWSSRWTSTPFATPVNCGSGVNVTLPFSSIT